MKLQETIRASFLVACPIVFFLYDHGRPGEVVKLLKINFFQVFFCCCGLFHQDFGEVRAQIIPYLEEIVRLCFIITCPIVIIFINDRYRQEEVLKFLKNVHF